MTFYEIKINKINKKYCQRENIQLFYKNVKAICVII